MDNRIFKNLPQTKFEFRKIWKIHEIFFDKIREIFVFQCIQREHVHN